MYEKLGVFICGVSLGIGVGYILKADNTETIPVFSSHTPQITNTYNSNTTTIPYFNVTLIDGRNILVKIEYKISGFDVNNDATIKATIIKIARLISTSYEDSEVYSRNLSWHLNDKIPIMTGSKRFEVVKVTINNMQ